MFRKNVWRISILLIVTAMLLGACGTQAAAPTTAPEKKVPTELKIALINQSPLEEPWNTAMIQSLDRVIAQKPHGLTISYTFGENIATPDGERVLRQYASTGEYGIIWAHGVYTDAVEAMRTEFPDLVVGASGSGFEGKGGNMYWGQMYVHGPAYLMGMMAGLMTKTNTVGVVAAYPFPNVNLPVNGYIAGVKAVNPEAKVKVTYIESWYDPPKGKESAIAQIAAGADFIYAERFGPFEAATEKGVYAFGHYVDQNSLAPETVISGTIAKWDPVIMTLVDAWWEHTVNGTPYNAPTSEIVFNMAQGGCDLAPYHDLDSKIPQDVKDAIAKAKQDILDGKLVVPFNEEPATSE